MAVPEVNGEDYHFELGKGVVLQQGKDVAILASGLLVAPALEAAPVSYTHLNMAVRVESMVQRPLHYAIVDEVDSILIDEARTPLIISCLLYTSRLKSMMAL